MLAKLKSAGVVHSFPPLERPYIACVLVRAIRFLLQNPYNAGISNIMLARASARASTRITTVGSPPLA